METGKPWHVGARHHVRALQGVGGDASRRAIPPAVLQIGGRGGGRRGNASDAERNARGGDADEVGVFSYFEVSILSFPFSICLFPFSIFDGLFVAHASL